MKTILVTGGARSGKSHYAQHMAEASRKQVLFVATAQAGDDEMRRRIEDHRRARPASWHTLEAPDKVGRHISQEIGDAGLILIDCITLLVSNVMGKFVSPSGDDVDVLPAEQAVSTEIDELVDCLKQATADFIIVTNEVGLGLVPDNKLGRIYRDLLGKANQRLALAANEVYFMVSGLPLKVKP